MSSPPCPLEKATVYTQLQGFENLTNFPSLTLPLQRGGTKISSFPPLQGGIKGGIETCVYKVA
jgi:hypothetical protein